VVWVGGIAPRSAASSRLLDRQGWFGPARVMLGALLPRCSSPPGNGRGAENLSGLAGIPTAHIPGVLTAAGTTVAFADIYAAYVLYGFFGPPVAFLLLGRWRWRRLAQPARAGARRPRPVGAL
jgi:hypothetical protein